MTNSLKLNRPTSLEGEENNDIDNFLGISIKNGKNIRGILKDFKELSSLTRDARKKGHSKRIREKSQALSKDTLNNMDSPIALCTSRHDALFLNIIRALVVGPFECDKTNLRY